MNTEDNTNDIPNKLLDSENNTELEDDAENFNPITVQSKKYNIMDSDDEGDVINDETALEPLVIDEELINEAEQCKNYKRIDLFDSDSEEDVTSHNKSFEEPIIISQLDAAPVYTTNSNGEIILESEAKPMKSRLENLCDSDSEEESPDHHSTANKLGIVKTAKNNVKKSVQTKEIQPKKMTLKDAAEQRKEIRSEMQRMIREKNVSLPYHRPKSRSLQEFLLSRSKLASVVSVEKSVPASVAIKMSAEQLQLISERQQKREIELKEFYKSESESDNEEDKIVPSTDDKVEKISSCDIKENEQNLKDITEVKDNCSLDVICTNINNEIDAENCDNKSEESINAIQSEVNCIEQNNSQELTSIVLMDENLPSEAVNEKVTEDHTNIDININKTPTDSYEFNLDDSIDEEFISKNTDVEIADDKINEKTNVISADVDKKSMLEILKEKLGNNIPKLRGGPEDMIDLDTVITKPKDVAQLMERFAKHVSVKKNHQHHHKVKLNVLRVETNGDIQQEEVAINVDSDDEMIVEEKPGVKLKVLKEELQKQMDKQKSELWKEKTINAGNKQQSRDTDGNDEKDILDDDYEEEEMTDEEDEEEDEIEDDLYLEDKPKKKSAFVDEEAEVTDEEEAAFAVEKDDYEESVKNDDDDDDDDDEEMHQYEKELLNCDESQADLPEKKSLKRIVMPVDDSDDEDELLSKSELEKLNLNSNMDSTVTADEDDITPHQLPQPKTPSRPEPSQTKSITDFLSPISFITSSKILKASTTSLQLTEESGENVSAQITQSKENEPQVEIEDAQNPKSLPDNEISESSQCLGVNSFNNFSNQSSNDLITTQNILDVCSGQFTGITQVDAETLKPSADVNSFANNNAQISEEKNLNGDEDMIITQLLDEEELENFKKKFESPVTQSNNSELVIDGGGGRIDSDDEDAEEGLQVTYKSNVPKKIQFSDEETSDEEDNEEIIDLHNDDDEADDNIEYDSEENEIDADSKKKFKLADFVEAEAELSESEWGSADEDEKELDEMEVELGDAENFDDEKVRSDLEKIHMRRLLDDDNREVKLLQELLLEDGEMHGKGRQRQFKWKNIDLNDDQNEDEQIIEADDDDAFLDEEESEEQWRKKRHEREMFLKENLKKIEIQEDLSGNNSQLLKIGQQLLERSQSNQNSQKVTSKNDEINKAAKGPLKSVFLNLQKKRGSFLNRNDQVLQRVAEFTKESSTKIEAGAKKTTKHVLFQSAEAAIALEKGQKRKAAEVTPNRIKKLRYNNDVFSPTLKKLEESKNLFNF